MNIEYNSILDTLRRKTKIEQIKDNEFIIYKDNRTGQEFSILVHYSEDLKADVNKISEKIKRSYIIAEKKIILIGIIFSNEYLVFLRRRFGTIGEVSIEKLKKRIDRINYPFKKKFERVIKNIDDLSKWEIIFDRTDLIDEFYKLYSKAKDNLLKNIEGIYEDEKKEEFCDELLMQILIIWFLQEKGFLNNDTNYLVKKFHKFKELTPNDQIINLNPNCFNEDGTFRSFYSFLNILFSFMMKNPNEGPFNNDAYLGKIVITGTAPFINGNMNLYDVSIPDDIFYVDGETEYLKKTDPNNISTAPILNLFESRDWTKGNIDEYVLGAIYEKLITMDKRKKTGAFYTPEDITTYISNNSIDKYLLGRINKEFNNNYENINKVFEGNNKDLFLFIFEILNDIKICDPSVGSGHFLESAIEYLLSIYQKLRQALKNLDIKNGLNIKIINNDNNIESIELLEISDDSLFKLYVKFFIILSRNVYGVDINPSALKVSRARLFLILARHFNNSDDINEIRYVKFPNIHFNLRVGNSLIGFMKYEKMTSQIKLDFFSDNAKIENLTQNLEILSELKDYLESTSKMLGITININENINELNNLLNKRVINYKDFLKILNFKSKIVKILVASLDSQYALKINSFLNYFNSLFISKFNYDYSLKKSINLEELLKIKTFNWILEFPEVFLKNKGFDVIIGNPPYGIKVLSDQEMNLLNKYEVYGTRDICGFFVEREICLLNEYGVIGNILAESIIVNKNMTNVRDFLRENGEFKLAFFGSRPSKIFKDNEKRISLLIGKKGDSKPLYTSKNYRFTSEQRKDLFNQIEYISTEGLLLGSRVGLREDGEETSLPKLGSKITKSILNKIKMFSESNRIFNDIIEKSGKYSLQYRLSAGYWIQVLKTFPYTSSKVKAFYFNKKIYRDFGICCFNSSLFYLFWTIYGNNRDLPSFFYKVFPIPNDDVLMKLQKEISDFADKIDSIQNECFNPETGRTGEFDSSRCKRDLDLLDDFLAQIYNFNDEELEFIKTNDSHLRSPT